MRRWERYARARIGSLERPTIGSQTPAESARMSGPSNWPRNRLLLALPPSNLKRLMPELEQIPCEREQVLLDADSSLDHVFFPDSGVVGGGGLRRRQYHRDGNGLRCS
jgi:hypothetical protein